MNSVTLTGGFVSSLLNNREFFKVMPEFMPVRARAVAQAQRKTGCKKCQKRANDITTLQGFYSVVRSLGSDRLKKFKQFISADQVTFTVQRTVNGQISRAVIKL